jgi:hypothetical protein
MEPKRDMKIGLDWWSVIAALGAVVLVKLGIVTHIPW